MMPQRDAVKNANTALSFLNIAQKTNTSIARETMMLRIEIVSTFFPQIKKLHYHIYDICSVTFSLFCNRRVYCSFSNKLLRLFEIFLYACHQFFLVLRQPGRIINYPKSEFLAVTWLRIDLYSSNIGSFRRIG